MPSNSQKRKAAKRKKGKKTAHVDAPTNSQGNGVGGRDEHNHISHDEKDSETGDLSSPSSREPSATGDRDDSSWSGGADIPMEGESGNIDFAKPVEQAENQPSVTEASGDVRVEYVKVIEGDDGSSSGSSSDEESRSAQIATAEGDLEGPVDHSVVAGKTADPSEQVHSSSQLSVTSVVLVPEAVTSATIIEPDGSGDSIVKKPEEVVTSIPESGEAAPSTLKVVEEVVTSIPESGEAAPSTLKVTEEVVTSVIESERAVPSGEEHEDKTSSAAEEIPSEKPRADADFPETGNRENSVNEIGLASLPVRATSWKSCCGLFELVGSSNR
ncbi:lisH domain-containing protein C1711.05-like [Aristolochia californica]|uniref:lisH domain-containing protein C1711.05-like n=1 Tax=Aristolochia californica TaxID=171875 RepID=UPI0035DED72B